MELVATAESTIQAKALLAAGVDTLYIGEERFGLRLPNAFTREEIAELTEWAHRHNKQIRVAVNAIMHNDMIKDVIPYLAFLEEIGVDSITVGDPGVIHLLRTKGISLPYQYDAQTLVTSSNQINFWAKRGAIGAVLARELTAVELKEIAAQVTVPVEVLVYGATCIHQSKRNLLKNYFGFVEQAYATEKERGLFISEPKNKDTHYSIYEDLHGTHIFATNDISLMDKLGELAEAGLTQWKLDGIFTKGDDFVSIAKLFVEAKEAITSEKYTEDLYEKLAMQLKTFHPAERGLDEGFYEKDPSEIQ
ncbi:peptidase U32 family protein [Oceanobacillus saliphilus]|uniref:peptidase U32 family protein n=1 Tax=Oceanobacillus saliphilus TaxID=2925834 RepID=UPI003F688A69